VPRREVLRRLPAATTGALRGHDLLLYSAGVTFYAAIALVPGLLIAARLLSAVLGREALGRLSDSLTAALPSAMGADDVAGRVLLLGSSIGWTALLVSLLPATLYGEGLRRAYVALADARDRLIGWRGRLAVLPLLVAAPALLLAVLAVTPLLGELFGEGIGGRVLGVYLALNVDWLVVAFPLAWTFRVVAPDRLPWPTCIVGGLCVGAFVAGFLQGFVLFLSLPLDLGAPFGGETAVGGAIAVLLWLWVLHLVVLVGWVATREAHQLRHPGRAGWRSQPVRPR
jgi:membrane protein